MLIGVVRGPRAVLCSVLVIIFVSFSFPACAPKVQPTVPPTSTQETDKVMTAPEKARNVILLIGDGMGLAQISGGMYLNKNKTSLEKFPVVGLHKSYSADNLVTDSAAGATAMSCGVKTFNGAVGVDIERKPRETILEEAERKGLATGLLSTSSIVHATPASDRF